MCVAFLDKRFGGRQRDDFENAARREPGRTERRPAGPVGLVFIAQGGDGGGAAVPDTGRFLKRLWTAFADQGAMDAGEEALDAGDQRGSALL